MTRSIRKVVMRLRGTTLALALLAPALTQAQGAIPSGPVIGSPSLGPAVGQTAYGGLVGLELAPSGFDVGPRFTAEGMHGFLDLMPQLRLDIGGRVSFGYHSGDLGSSMWLIEAVPDARLRYGLMEDIGVYGDIGLGLAIMHASFPNVTTPSGVSFDTTDLALTFQLGFGATYAITPHIDAMAEMRFDFYTKSGLGTFITIPAIGISVH